MRALLSVILILSTFSVARGKKDSPAINDSPPSNLNLNVVIASDSSGNVAFTASAIHAVNYVFDFGNNVSQTSASGNCDYKFSFSGTYSVTVIANSAGGQTISKTITVDVGVKLTLVWFDEFNVSGSPDPAKWGYDLGTGSGGWGNNELEYYTNRPENAFVSNGTLKIIAIKELYSGSTYTSARMLSKNIYAFKYGKIEVRAKLPAATGTWPAIWMLGSNITSVGWPACGEIDIMEQDGSQKSKIYGTMHYPSQVGQYGDGTTTPVATASTEFHNFAALWTPGSIQLSVDDVVFYTLSNNPALPFNQNFFIILNLAMGGNLGGAVDPAFTSDQMEIDYVRVYQ